MKMHSEFWNLFILNSFKFHFFPWPIHMYVYIYTEVYNRGNYAVKMKYSITIVIYIYNLFSFRLLKKNIDEEIPTKEEKKEIKIIFEWGCLWNL